MVSLLLRIAKEHTMYRPEICALISNVIRLNPENISRQRSDDIKTNLIQALVDLIWTGHSKSIQSAPDGKTP